MDITGPFPNGVIVRTEMTIGRKNPDGTIRLEHVTVETDYDRDGNIISQTEETDG